MKRLAILLAIAAIVAYATGAFAFLNDNGKIVVSLRAIDSKGRCEYTGSPTPTLCSQLHLTGLINTPYHCQILVADFNNLTAEEFGICYPEQIFVGTDKLDCTPNAFVLKSPAPHPWPASGSGVVVAHACVNYTGTLLNLGFIYVFAYSPGTFCICGSPRANTAELTDCNGKTDVIWPIVGNPSHLGCVGFGVPGYDGSCGQSTPTTPSTWGNIKALYK